jgi:2-polyprenyl-6-methoxyphenol hydroxylase-like FAD-dependent oxidoreductase
METDVLIAGAGPAGLAMAAELRRHGVSSRIVDAAAEPAWTSRAIAVHSRTLELLEPTGITGELLREGLRLTSAEFHGEHGSAGHISFDQIDAPYPFILSVSQATTERVLTECLSDLGGTVERPVALTSFTQSSECVTSTLEHPDGTHETVRSRWLIGCDGAHSTVRRVLALPFMGAPYAEQFLLADVRIAWPMASNRVDSFFHPDGMLLVLPLPGGRHRIIAALGSDPEQNESENPNFEQLEQLFSDRVPVSAVLTEPVWISRFRIHHRVVNQYREGRVFIAGDAAHLHSPAGGQGMNTGIQDAINLAWKLALCSAGKSQDSLLDTYGEERIPIAHSVISLTDRMTAVGTLRSPILQKIRNAALPFVSSWGILHHALVNDLAELKLNYRGSSIVEGEGPFPSGAPHPGDRAPMSRIGPRTVGVILTGSSHHLFVFAGDHASYETLSVLAALRRDLAAVYPELIQVHTFLRAPSPLIQDAILDSDGHVHRDYGADGPSLYLIRPDRYIAYRSAPPDDAALHRFLRAAYGFRPKPAEVLPDRAFGSTAS